MKRIERFLSNKGVMAVLALSLVIFGTTSYVMAGESCEKGYLGVNIEELSAEAGKELGVEFGVLVSRVIEGEAAAKAGIREKDVIQFFNDEKIGKPGNLVEAVRAVKPGAQAKVKLVRDKKKKEVTVTLGKLSSSLKWFGLKGDEGKGFAFLSGGGGFLGVHLLTLNEDLAGYFGVKKDGGALVVEVEAESPAHKAGLKAGDVIVKIDGKGVSGPGDARKILGKLKEGDKIDVEIVRHKTRKTVKAELAESRGFKKFKIFKDFDKKIGCNFDFHIPNIHIEIPEFHKHEIEAVWNEKARKKLEEKMKEVNEKLRKKLKTVHRYISI